MECFKFLAGRSLIQQTTFLIAAFVSISALMGWYIYASVNQIKVNGPVYQDIMSGKDLDADVKTPRLSLIEIYLTALRSVGEADPDKLLALLESIKSFKSAHDNTNEFWKTKLSEDQDDKALLELMVQEGTAAEALFAALDGDFQQKILEGKPLEAKDIFDTTVTEKLRAHQQILQQLSALSEKEQARLESAAENDVSSRLKAMLISSVAVLLLMLLVTYLFMSSITRRLKLLSDAAVAISKGDINTAERLLE